ncbi:hypothetical protein B6U81_07040 [Thermoplasmatales archaeon ex4484_30]|nr:MAG: DUF373 family protein [Thermoplasmata archaeon]OYT58892.1 MAG: hypothetical protein B6U81_07040 [Thermoplasmatales archaeon ex4484_30]
MKTLVLCIDRDNDFGRKAGISSPVIGRKENLKAAEKLALVDPEDTDVNCLFSAISTYDELENAEIATICGDINVGIASDEILSKQLDEVLNKVKPDRVIVVTDGAEDEYIIPIIESRIKIDAIKRVVVKQSQTLEGTYYLISRLMKDEKLQRRVMLPIAIVLLIWGFATLFGSMALGLSSIFIVLGIYLLIRILHIEGWLIKAGKEILVGLKKGRMTIFSSILSVFIIIIAIVLTTNRLRDLKPPEYVIQFINDVLWWFIIAILLIALGRFIDVYFKERRVLWNYSIIPFSLLAFGLILSASFTILLKISEQIAFHVILTEYVLSLPFLTKIIGGILIAFIGSVLYHILEDVYKEEEK